MVSGPGGLPFDMDPPSSVPPWLLAEDPDGGAPGGRICAFCGEEAPPDSAFCPKDGKALTAALFPASGTPLTVVFTDIEDSVKLTELLGDFAWADIVDAHNVLVRQSIEQHAGFEVKVTGDGFLIVFADPAQAVRCAWDIQQRMVAHAALRPDWPVRIRIGIHRGDVILRPGGDVLGRTVNMAERVMSKAAGGEIWLSSTVHDEVQRGFPEWQWLDRGARRLRGVSGRQHLYEVEWDVGESADYKPL